MTDQTISKDELSELSALRMRVAELEALQEQYGRSEKISPEGEGCDQNNGVDVTDPKRAGQQNLLNIRILDLINTSIVWKDSIESILNEIKEYTGFDAIAIRLHESEDFPYYVTQGFSAEFVEAERYLCLRDDNGEMVRDSGGNPFVECMCGNVLCGRIDPNKHFFTEGGSFWSNNTSKLLAETTDEDRQVRTRNRCNSEGYESVALVPLKAGHEILGLIQLNDMRTNRFSKDVIQFFEGVGKSIGIAFLRKQVENQLRESLDEKELLLKEVHHRVKNNLQIVSSLINFQMDQTDDKISSEIMEKCRVRIDTISNTHEKMYQTSDFRQIDFARYLRDIATDLHHNYTISTDKIGLRLDVNETYLHVEQAIPCGLIINELMFNALKHAFPRIRKGDIRVYVQEEENGQVLINIADNGVGLPKGFDLLNTKSMGLNLVNSLARQLKAEVELNSESGTSFSIRFRKLSKY